FEFHASNVPKNLWKIDTYGLQGSSVDLFYWKPPIQGTLEIELKFQSRSLKNFGLALMANGFHRQVLLYFLCEESWAATEKGKMALFSTRVKRENSRLIASKNYDTTRFQPQANGISKVLYSKIHYTEGKWKVWLEDHEINPESPPLLEGKTDELTHGQIGFFADAEVCILELQITGYFDPYWLYQ
ncbi:MAG: hypothetical protein AABZ60_04505, partial [Planctomycetota bacterium]